MNRIVLKPIKMSMEASASIHDNVSTGYYNISLSGEKVFVPYTENELGEIHCFINPGRSKYKRMKWSKTHDWKDQKKAKQSKWKRTVVFNGLNTTK